MHRRNRFRRSSLPGRYGRKSNKGFYSYDKEGKKGEVDQSVYALFLAPGSIPMATSIVPPPGEPSARPEMPSVQIQQRTVLAMLNEAARCFSEGIIRSPRDGDVGAVFGSAFLPSAVDHSGTWIRSA